MGYYINQLNNTYNKYKYQYLDHLTATIDLRDNYWAFNTELFLINDFNLPVNSLVGNLQIPYQELKDISFNLATDQSRAAESVVYNKNYCKIYTGNFNLDVSQNAYLKQNLNNTKLSMMVDLEIDPEVVKQAGTEIKQEDLDGLLNETLEQRWNFDMYYSNTYLINQNKEVDSVYGYTLPKSKSCVPKVRQVQVSSNDLSGKLVPINNLATLSSSVKFQILSAKVKFYYWLELDTEAKTLEANIPLDHSFTNQIDINLNNNTIFDFINNKVVIDPMGVNGFYIPKYSHGYYELELNILQDNNTNKFIIKNLFSFIGNINKPYVSVGHVLINDLTGFKEAKLND